MEVIQARAVVDIKLAKLLAKLTNFGMFKPNDFNKLNF